ncbi:MAG: carboxypeptidase regulatory-like domain-containing protein [Acidobacteria bacterium]|nr:carboxypeptidase regulatory-like domain-containing protein [Acidobacteriota bacterium]
MCTSRVLTLVCLTAVAAFAQSTTQQISGFVKDSSGAVVPAASVTLRSTGTGQVRTSPVNDAGLYVFANVGIGDYEITAEAPGFKKYQRTGVTVSVNSKLTVDISLEVGAVTESVTVTADAIQVESSTGEIGRLVTGQQATKLQLNGRNFAQLLALLPGVSTTNRSSFDLFGGFGSNNSAQSVNGSRNYTYSWNIDGADNKDNGGGGNNFVNINPDAIAEFRVLTANYSAEYGQNAGAVINLALKSGTTAFHGAAYEFVRNDAFDARAWNTLRKQKLRFNNFGWNLGGPVYWPGRFNTDKSKLFFFVGQEFKRLRQGQVNTWNVPDLAQRNGDFSRLPAAQQPRDPATGQPFAGGVIPASRFSPNAKRLVDNYPAPNFTGAGGNFVFTPTAPLNTNQYIYKVDWNLSSKHQIAVHYLRDYYTSVQNLANLALYDRNIPGTNSSAKWTWIQSPTTVNSLQFTFTGNVIRQMNFRPNPIFITDYSRRSQGITYPQIYGVADDIPSINITGFNALNSNPRTWNNFNRIFQLKDDVSKTIGTHNLKLGILIMRSRKNQDNVPSINGTFSFRAGHPLSTGNALGDALLGNFFDYTEADSNREGWFRFSQIETYLHDNWKASQRLSLDLGLRFQYMQPQYSALQNAVVFNPRFYDPAKAVTVLPSDGQIVRGSGDLLNGLAIGGSEFPEAARQRIPLTSDPAVKALFRGLPKEISPVDWGTWGPRLGFAYDLGGDQTTVLRGGAGLFFERVQGNFLFSRVNNPPFVQQTTIFSANVENPAGGTQRLFPSSVGSYDIDLRVPRVANWSLGIQRKVAANAVLDVAYVASSGWAQYRQINLNQLREGTVQRNPGVNINALRPYRGFAAITQFITGANFQYHSLQTQFRKQLAGGGLLNVAYTWGKATTDASGYSETPMDSYNFKRDRGLADYQRQHVFVFSYVYPLPMWRAQRRWYEKAFGGWELSGVTTMQTGRPLNITIQPDRAGTGTTGQRPDVAGDWRVEERTARRWFNTAAFALPAPGAYGDLGRNVVIGPGTHNWDASLQKHFRISETLDTEFRAEFYNAPHHFSYFGVNGTFGSGSFGQVNSAGDPRTLQFGAKLTF